MRLGKEEAVGYVEDTADDIQSDALAAEENKTGQPQPLPLTQVPEPALPVG
ncbi:MAG TPA: hypothetical protein VGM12_16175 [Trebonia sp.]|jgi:hypothetical protein